MLRTRSIRHWVWLTAFASPGLFSSQVKAQADVSKPPSNVLLLVDTSGSMEFKTGTLTFPTCNPGNPTAVNETSRWIDLVEALTGSIEGYTCFAQSRSSPQFLSEYGLGTVDPLYDYGYVNPYHRILSNGCAIGPGVLPPTSAPYSFPDRAINTFNFSGNQISRPPTGSLPTWSGCTHSPGWSQLRDGILDIYADKLRFGLMTFDTKQHAGTGVNATEFGDLGTAADLNSGNKGTWSYGVNDIVRGWPVGCLEHEISQEVGARNAAAPPWEGRMVAFGPHDADTDDAKMRNEQIQQILLAQRPYGATPVAGQLHDARNFIWGDQNEDPLSTDAQRPKFGPADDPTTQADNCRKTTIILLSDGEPNLDLRPECAGTDGHCPYEKPELIAKSLFKGAPNNYEGNDPNTQYPLDTGPSPEDPRQTVETIVIGFALEKVTPAGQGEIFCADLTAEHCRDNPENRPLQACCTMNKIAEFGSEDEDGNPRKAYFAQNKTELRRVFSEILTQLSDSVSTRTSATFAPANNTTAGGGFQFNSGFTPEVEDLWRGTLTRTRTICVDGEPTEQPIDSSKGDDFIANVNSGRGARAFYTVTLPTANIHNERSIRPRITTDVDGVGAGTEGAMTAALDANGFANLSALTNEATAIQAQDCPAGNAAICKSDILGYVVGKTTSDGRSRCLSPGADDCNLVGAIYHSTPAVVAGAPDGGVRDETYRQFETLRELAGRPTVMYVSSIDGFLHAFKLAPYRANPQQEVTAEANNELWSFIPPAVLKHLKSQYNAEPLNLLDGAPVVKDVPARVENNGTQLFLERSVTDAQSGLSGDPGGAWRTILVQGFGDGIVGSGYFALDITDPVPSSVVNSGLGPKFLWQLTTDDAGAPLFGVGGTPTITTLFINDALNVPQEVAVAILPGGNGGNPTTTPADAGALIEVSDPDYYRQRPQVRSHSDAAAARSVTIVRLDTGKILKTFRPTGVTTTFTTAVVRAQDIPAPILGVPVAYPATTGAVADRAFIGDKEGRLWRINLRSTDPANWTMEVFFDLFWDKAFDEGEPIETPPVLSVDTTGRITVNVSSGAQSFAGASDAVNRLVSLTETQAETQNGSTLQAQLNWVETFAAGERVTGPMSLQDGTLYFASGIPPTAAEARCLTATSRVWGINYLLSVDDVDEVADPDPASGAAPGLLTTAGDDLVKSLSAKPGVIFGVNVEYQPTCTEGVEGYTGDAYAGLGAYRTTRNTAPGKTFLVYQVGGVQSGTANDGTRVVPRERLQLVPPERPAIVESWALISE